MDTAPKPVVVVHMAATATGTGTDRAMGMVMTAIGKTVTHTTATATIRHTRQRQLHQPLVQPLRPQSTPLSMRSTMLVSLAAILMRPMVAIKTMWHTINTTNSRLPVNNNNRRLHHLPPSPTHRLPLDRIAQQLHLHRLLPLAILQFRHLLDCEHNRADEVLTVSGVCETYVVQSFTLAVIEPRHIGKAGRQSALNGQVSSEGHIKNLHADHLAT